MTAIRTFKKMLSIVILSAFVLVDVAMAAPLVNVGGNPANFTSTSRLIPIDPASIAIPHTYATVKEFYKGSNGKLIIHIQDPHANISGQLNVASTINHFIERYGTNLVLVEGGFGDVTLDELKKVADEKNWDIVAKRYLQAGYISGAEYLNLTSPHKMRLMGIEVKELYDGNLRAYAEVTNFRNETQSYLRKIKFAINQIKNQIYPKSILQYESKKVLADRGYYDSNLQMDELLNLSKSTPINLEEATPEVYKLNLLKQDESKIDFPLINQEQTNLMKRLSDRGLSNEIKSYAKSMAESKSSSIAQLFVLSNLMRLASDQGISTTQYNNLVEYQSYLRQFSRLKMDRLLEEFEYLEDLVYKHLLPNDDVKKLRSIDKYVSLLEKAHDIRLSSREYQMLRANEPQFATRSWLGFVNEMLLQLGYEKDAVNYNSTLDKSFDGIKKFYSYVRDRDYAFVANANSVFEQSQASVAMMVAGGYHTENLTHLLRNAGYSYIVLTPVVEHDTDYSRYEEVLLMPLKDNGNTTSHEIKTDAPFGQIPKGSIVNYDTFDNDLIGLANGWIPNTQLVAGLTADRSRVDAVRMAKQDKGKKKRKTKKELTILDKAEVIDAVLVGDRVMIGDKMGLLLGINDDQIRYIQLGKGEEDAKIRRAELSDITEIVPPRDEPEFAFNPGDKVEIRRSDGKWYPATLVEAAGGGYTYVLYKKVHDNIEFYKGHGMSSSYYDNEEEALAYGGIRKVTKLIAEETQALSVSEESNALSEPGPLINMPDMFLTASRNLEIRGHMLQILLDFALHQDDAGPQIVEVVRTFRELLSAAFYANGEHFHDRFVDALRFFINHPEVMRPMTTVEILSQIHNYPGLSDSFNIAAREVQYIAALIQNDAYLRITGREPSIPKPQASLQARKLVEFLEPEPYSNQPAESAQWFVDAESVEQRMRDAVELFSLPLLDHLWSHPETGHDTAYVYAAMFLRFITYVRKAMEDGTLKLPSSSLLSEKPSATILESASADNVAQQELVLSDSYAEDDVTSDAGDVVGESVVSGHFSIKASKKYDDSKPGFVRTEITFVRGNVDGSNLKTHIIRPLAENPSTTARKVANLISELDKDFALDEHYHSLPMQISDLSMTSGLESRMSILLNHGLLYAIAGSNDVFWRPSNIGLLGDPLSNHIELSDEIASFLTEAAGSMLETGVQNHQPVIYELDLNKILEPYDQTARGQLLKLLPAVALQYGLAQNSYFRVVGDNKEQFADFQDLISKTLVENTQARVVRVTSAKAIQSQAYFEAIPENHVVTVFESSTDKPGLDFGAIFFQGKVRAWIGQGQVTNSLDLKDRYERFERNITGRRELRINVDEFAAIQFKKYSKGKSQVYVKVSIIGRQVTIEYYVSQYLSAISNTQWTA